MDGFGDIGRPKVSMALDSMNPMARSSNTDGVGSSLCLLDGQLEEPLTDRIRCEFLSSSSDAEAHSRHFRQSAVGTDSCDKNYFIDQATARGFTMTTMTTAEEIGAFRSEAARGDKLRGRVAFVTGGTRGIGAAISKSLVSQGATVAAGYGRNTEQAQKFLADLSTASDGAEVSVHQGDVASADDCRRTIREVIDLHGRLDILINNAGITIDKTVAKMTEDEWNKVIGVNLSGAFFLAQAALAHMLERGSGRIVMVSSVIGETGAIGQANYAASKAGLFGLTKTLAREACFQMGRAGKLTEGGIGVTVNAITPGYVSTEMVESIPEKVLNRIKDSIPMHRLAQPWEVARVVHFLAADASGYITGQVWGVNGGLDM
jgi:3-oxoacyl-[acyl-carrier protein] reductase